MFQTNNYPNAKRIIDNNYLPEELYFIEQNLDFLLKNIFLKNYRKYSSARGSTVSYTAKLLVQEDASLEIPGTGLRLILHESSQSGTTEADFSLLVERGFFKFLRNFNLRNFDFSDLSLFELLCSSVGFTEHTLLDHCISFYAVDGKPESLADKINDEYSSEMSNPINISGSTYSEKVHSLYSGILQEFQSSGYSVFDVVFGLTVSKDPSLLISKQLNYENNQLTTQKDAIDWRSACIQLSTCKCLVMAGTNRTIRRYIKYIFCR
jgi:hypothetical protein